MKILVVSDTHGRLTKLENLLKRYEDLDILVHLGDYIRDARTLAERTDLPVLAVAGNCDGFALYCEDEETEVLETPAGRIFLTHGHRYSVKRGVDKLLYKAAAVGARAVFFGHTHRPYIEEIDGVLVVNPGSLEEPRDLEPGSYALVEADEEGISASILYYRDKKHKGGFLKNLMNYSDRF